MRLRPIKNRIIVERDVEADFSKGGILIPDNMKEKVDAGTVTAVGDRAKDISVGDKVIFGKYIGEPFKLDGSSYVAMNDIDVVAVLT